MCVVLLPGGRILTLSFLGFLLQAVQRELKEACENARDRGQDAHVAQLAAEAKVSILERRVEECEQRVRCT